MMRLRIEPKSPETLANTVATKPMDSNAGIHEKMQEKAWLCWKINFHGYYAKK